MPSVHDRVRLGLVLFTTLFSKHLRDEFFVDNRSHYHQGHQASEYGTFLCLDDCEECHGGYDRVWTALTKYDVLINNTIHFHLLILSSL